MKRASDIVPTIVKNTKTQAEKESAKDAMIGKDMRPLSPSKMRVIEASEDLDPKAILYQHTAFCQTCLPYRDPGKDIAEWHRANGKIALLVTAKKVMSPKGEWVRQGIPFGPKARLILSDFNTHAIETGDPVIDLKASLTRYVRYMNLAPHGRNIRAVKDSMARLCSSQIQIALVENGHIRQFDAQLMTAFNIWFEKDERQRVLWPETATLDPTYMEALQSHGVPLHPAHYVALSHSAMAMDIYAWLAQRLHRVKGETQLVTWTNLHAQFGWHYHKDRLDKFRAVFRVALRQVLTVYKSARVESHEDGLTLRNSPPPIRKAQILVT